MSADSITLTRADFNRLVYDTAMLEAEAKYLRAKADAMATALRAAGDGEWLDNLEMQRRIRHRSEVGRNNALIGHYGYET